MQKYYFYVAYWYLSGNFEYRFYFKEKENCRERVSHLPRFPYL